MKYTNKTNFTENQIMKSLIDNIEITNFDKITVNDIVNQIHINRSTFYRHFEDKYELLETIEKKLIADIHEERKQNIGSSIFDNKNRNNFINSSLKIFVNHRSTLHALLGTNGDPSFILKLQKNAGGNFYDRLKSSNSNNDLKILMLKNSIINLVFNLLQQWILSDKKISIDEMTFVIDSVIVDGPTKSLNSLMQNNNF